jgi:pyridoxamine 5'-phosphate oxidase
MSSSPTPAEESAIAELRREYRYGTLSARDVQQDPLQQFRRWFAEAERAQVLDYSAMALATSQAGVPSARIVLLKGLDETGFRWFTDGRSEKGQALAENPQAELLFHWRELDRQVRVRGGVTRLSEEESDAYFYSRPLDSQLAAATSEQSQPVDSRASLERRYQALTDSYPQQATRPQAWGGYCLTPTQYEFWQGREGRLHDRLQFRSTSSGWAVERLQP